MKKTILSLLLIVFAVSTALAANNTPLRVGVAGVAHGHLSDHYKAPTTPEGRVVVAYVGAGSDVMPDPFVMTHINYAFGHVNKTFNGVEISKPERLKKITALKTQNPNLKVLISIGGWGSGRFSEMASNAVWRKQFADDCARIMKEYNLDGIDIDWEYPTSGGAGISESNADTHNYTLMMRDIRESIGKDALLTLATSHTGRFIDFPGIIPYISFVNVMSYDMGTPPFALHNGLYTSDLTRRGNCQLAIERHIKAGMPITMLTMGLPFYGRGGRGYRDYLDWKDYVEWKQTGKLKEMGLTERWNDEAKVPYLEGPDGKPAYTFENEESMRLKCEYIRNSDLLGGMYWEYTCDDPQGTMRHIVANELLKSDIEESKNNKWENPIIPGFYADPEGIIYDNTCWIFPTLSWLEGDDLTPEYKADWQRSTRAMNTDYNLQTHFDAFSSTDFIHWQKHPEVLHMRDVKWAEFAMWAPSVIRKDGKYYLFFGANDVHEGEVGGIGVAVADRPEGPYKDALGAPMISHVINGAQPIDQFVFHDPVSGEYYMYYGGWQHCNIVRLTPDLLHIRPFADGTMYKEVTPEKYVEGPFMLYRNGKYYFMWSEGGWGGPDYSVAYAISDTPFGPFKRIGKILQQDPDVATGAGHHSVVQDPSNGNYYIIYHRRPLDRTGVSERQTCIDLLQFNDDGTIKPIKMT